MKLTQATIARLVLPAGKSEAIFFDEDLSGFGVRLRAGGSRKFIVQYTLGARQRRMTIGTAEGVTKASVAAAKKHADELLARVRIFGHDPAAERTSNRLRASEE